MKHAYVIEGVVDVTAMQQALDRHYILTREFGIIHHHRQSEPCTSSTGCYMWPQQEGNNVPIF